MLFFQLLLFGGYLYAHLLRTFLKPAAQAGLHLTLLCGAALLLPIEPSDAWKPSGNESPTLYLLWMLAAHVGLPYFVLSSTGPLIQAWLSYQDDSDRVYRLYALSNAGSLFALLSYPFVVEPMLSVSGQSSAWSLMFCGFVLVQGVVAIGLFRVKEQSPADATGQDGPATDVAPSWSIRACWIALPALASTMLLCVTNHVCQDVAVVPFLWVLPLSLYLLSFIICFDSPQWYRPKLTALITMLAVAAIQIKSYVPTQLSLVTEASSFMILLMGVCLLCHGEVARLKPPTRLLTQYYAMLSAGGAIGGLIVAVVCPFIFDSYIELSIGVNIVTMLAFLLYFACQGWKTTEYKWSEAYRLRYCAGILAILPVIYGVTNADSDTIARERNFFGVLRVDNDAEGMQLIHGSTIHGMQRHGKDALQPTTYYGYESGVGLAIRALQEQKPSLKIGIVGLGCGVLTTYGRPSDEYDIIEINPAVLDIAQTHFTFMQNCPSTIRHHLGDGRLVLERMTEKKFDILVLDAFSSDAIPAHLLTREAIGLFQDRLADDGVLAVHVSNNHLDLIPLVHRLSLDAGLTSRVVRSLTDNAIAISSANWMLVTRDGNSIWQLESMAESEPATEDELARAPLWTDQSHNLVSVLRIWGE
tara:strand:+ start:190157 stop:192085 length:1929 start_codon:yes stop_codon:yes gene_type:complete